MAGKDDEVLDGLTDEERAALEEDDGSGTTSDNQEGGDVEKGNDGAGDAGDGANADGTDSGADDGKSAAEDGKQEAQGRDDGAPAAEAAPVNPSAPLLVAQAPEDADAKLKDIAGKKEELLTKFDDGDITAREYQTQLDTLAKQEREIELALHTAKIAQDMEVTRQRNEWARTVDGFIKEHTVYDPTKNPRLYKLLDAEVRAVAVTDEFKNRNDPEAGLEILKRAHANIAAEIPVAAGGKPPAPKKDAPGLPPNLANVPAAEMNDTAGGKYAALDRLAAGNDPTAYEEALMKLPEAERLAYLATA